MLSVNTQHNVASAGRLFQISTTRSQKELDYCKMWTMDISKSTVHMGRRADGRRRVSSIG